MTLPTGLLNAIAAIIRRMLPKSWDFCLVCWDGTNPSELHLSMISKGNPGEMLEALTEVTAQVKTEALVH
jgi:hypothetical protein